MATIQELEAQLAEARKQEAIEQEARKAATPPVWKFTILPDEKSHNKSYDPTCVFYRLAGDVTNREEAEAAGWSSLYMRSGSISYVYNTVTECIVTDVGGGTIFVSEPWKSRGNDDIAAKTFQRIGWFLSKHPEGGDITDIVLEHRKQVDS